MSFSQVLQNIQQNIVANGVNAITADVLRPILESMLIQPNELIGDLSELETADQTSLVNAINEALQLLGEEQIPPVPITRATLSDLIQDMNAGNLIKDFIYRSEADGYFHFKGLSDLPFSGDLVPIVPESGQVDSIAAGAGIDVDSTDPVTPIVALNNASIASLGLADTALQSGDNVSELVNDVGYLTTIPADAEWLANFPLGLVKFDKHYSVGTPTAPQTGGLTLDLTGAKVGRVDTIYYTGTALPAFVTQWLQETDVNFVANETCYIGLHLHKLDGANSVITGVVNNI